MLILTAKAQEVKQNAVVDASKKSILEEGEEEEEEEEEEKKKRKRKRKRKRNRRRKRTTIATTCPGRYY
jgi:hypothetical protein